MESLRMLVAAIEAWALVLFCRSAQVAGRSVTFSPSQITKPMGDTAEFNCTFSDTYDPEYKLNWYKVRNGSQPVKIKELRGEQGDGKYSVARVDSHSFKAQILNLERNDTGEYFCGLITTSSTQSVIESNRSILTVTEKANTTAEPGRQGEEPEERNARGMTLVYIGGAGLILGLPFWAFLLFKAIRRKREEQPRPAGNGPLEEDPPAANIFTVDYGILEFPRKPLPKQPPAEKTEYATIVFPECRKPPGQPYCLSRAQLH